MTVFSVRIPGDLKKKMDDLSSINWSEEVRLYLRQRVQEEQERRNIDPLKLERASKSADDLRLIHKAESGWNSTDELRKWREHRK